MSSNSQPTSADEHVETLSRLNALYIQAAANADADLFQTFLAGDFLCSTPEGALLDREAFLQRNREGSPMRSLEAEDVRIRVMGTVALVHARTRFALPDGRAGTGRYTDVWALRNGSWLAVSAHVTRLL